MYTTILLEHSPQIVLVHRPGHLTNKHFYRITIRLLLFDRCLLRIQQIIVTGRTVIVIRAIVVVVVVTTTVVVIVVIHGQSTVVAAGVGEILADVTTYGGLLHEYAVRIQVAVLGGWMQAARAGILLVGPAHFLPHGLR